MIELACSFDQIAAKRAVMSGAALIDENEIARLIGRSETLRYVCDDIGGGLSRSASKENDGIILARIFARWYDDDAKREHSAATRGAILEYVSLPAASRALKPFDRARQQHDRRCRSTRLQCWRRGVAASRGKGQ
jgi:hypothetical protein